MRVFITGIAGFIGFHATQALLNKGYSVEGLDNFNDYYNPLLKIKRAEKLEAQGVIIHRCDLNDFSFHQIIANYQPTHVLHLAAQAGVRYSLKNPQAYVSANIQGFTEVLEFIRKNPKIKLVYASSSSVYGLNSKLPYSISDRTDQQASFYGVTKKTNELMASSYRHCFGIRAIGLRFFTVYGPWGRPDMAYFSFTEKIENNQSIDLYNFGNMQRDFTYIDDIVEGTIAALNYTGSKTLFNLGNHFPVSLLRFVEILEQSLGKKAKYNLLPLQTGDVLATYADIEDSQLEFKFYPKTSLEVGLPKFVEWYQETYKNLQLIH